MSGRKKRPKVALGVGSSSSTPPFKRPNIIQTLFPLNGKLNLEDLTNTEYVCSLCFEQYKDPHMTSCGHTYCFECIQKFMEFNQKCPKCAIEVSKEFIVPNREIYNLMKKKEISRKEMKVLAASALAEKEDYSDLHAFIRKRYQITDPFESMDVQTFIRKKYQDLNIADVELLMTILNRKKEILQTESEMCRRELVQDFLTELKRMKEAELRKVQEDLTHIEADLNVCIANNKSSDEVIQTPIDSPEPSRSSSVPKDLAFNVTDQEDLKPSVAQRKLKLHSHFEELAGMYLNGCHQRGLQETKGSADWRVHVPEDKYLENFTETLVRISRYNGFKLLATLTYGADILINACIVSTIEFDKDNEYFAIAGVTKRIKLFEYASVIASAVDIHCPNGEIICPSKLSCVSYSCFYKNKLASSDYDGRVSLWDTSNGVETETMNEHERRVWSVDWSDSDPRFLVSGSDDCKVKLWCINQNKSAVTLQTKANVCCVKFVPGTSYNVAFGSADHSIQYYDFRYPKAPLRVYEGHKKAVSYVKFASKNELISASTDSNLKLWSLDGKECVRSYAGHVNDKNFVGLTTDGNYLACGSEDNSVCVYYKHISYPILKYKFDNHRSMILPGRAEEVTTEFVSAVAWRPGSPVILAANSQGIIKVVELV